MDEFEINIFLTPEDETDYLIEIMGAAAELIRSGRVSEGLFYLDSVLNAEEVDIEH